MLETAGSPRATQASSSSTFEESESMASTTRSSSGSSSPSTVSPLMKTWRASTWQAGWMSRTRAEASATLGWPSAEWVASSWRLMLVALQLS
jgi:hypothetical protein